MRESTQSTRSKWDAILLSIVICAFFLVLPGTAPFINDEPLLLLEAMSRNANHTLATYGLTGSLGRPYGPVAVWVYQGLLCLTHEPVALLFMRAILVLGGLGCGVYLIGRTAGLWRWGMPVVLASPYVWLYSRQLWDNSFNLALGPLAVGLYAVFLARKNAPALFGAIVVTGLTLLVHLSATPLALSLAAHCALFQRDALRRHWRTVLLAFLLVNVISGPYIVRFVAVGQGAVRPDLPSLSAAAVHPLLSAQLLTGAGLSYFFSTSADPSPGLLRPTAAYLTAAGGWSTAFLVATLCSLLPFAGMWWQIGATIRDLARRRWPTTVAAQLGVLAVMTFALTIPLSLATRTAGHPHYYTATFVAPIILFWLALDSLARRSPRLAAAAAGLHTVAGLALVGLLLVRLTQTAGTRGDGFGTTLGEQVRVQRELATYRPDVPRNDLSHHYPFAPACLADLLGMPPVGPKSDVEELRVEYAEPGDVNSARLKVVGVK